MSVSDVKNALARVVSSPSVTRAQLDQVISSAGSISVDEEQALREAVDSFTTNLSSEDKNYFLEKIGEIAPTRAKAESRNQSVAQKRRALEAEMSALLKSGAATQSFGGSALPEEVKQFVRDALEAGASAYDVREMKGDPVYDTEHGDAEMVIDGKYNPYAQEQRATDSLAFDHTELTPQKIEADMTTPQTFNVQNGFTDAERQNAKFEQVTQVGNGRITDLYDEARWSDTFARAPGGQKYASNFAILSDGSIHCVPASRRTADEPSRILTTASLGRGKLMLFNGHLRMDKGVVTYVGKSGRLCKLEERGDAKFVDPVALLKAWGFKLAPGLTVTNEG